jgi:hypothetical protein
MRKITESAVEAFKNGVSFRGSNTTVSLSMYQGHYVVSMYLFGNKIAERTEKDVCVCDGGYRSNTTKERLNGVLSAYGLPTVSQKKGVWVYSNGVPFGDSIDSEENFHEIG